MSTMRAMVLERFGAALELREVPLLSPGEDEVLVSVEACGVCGTDLKLQRGVFADTPLPLVLGHEIAGRVVAIGGPSGEPLIGSLVAIPLSWTCGRCAACRRGADQFCSAMVGRPGFTVDGGLRDALCAPAAMVVPLAPDLDPCAAALLADCISTVHHAIGRAGIQVGERVLVIGAGGLGLHAIQLLRGIGAEVTASEPDPVKRRLALERGAAEAIEPPALTELAPADGNVERGFDAAFDFVGSAATTAVALERLVPGGRLVLVGYTPGEDVSSAVMAMVSNERQILGSRSSVRADLVEASELLADGALDAVVDRTYELAQVNQALADLAGGAIAGRGVVDLRIGR